MDGADPGAEAVVPAHAGVIPRSWASTARARGGSRTRGGDPQTQGQVVGPLEWFPHTRG